MVAPRTTGWRKWAVAAHLVPVPPPDPDPLQVPVVGQIAQDRLGGRLGDPNPRGDVSNAEVRAFGDAGEHQEVVREERPAGGASERDLADESQAEGIPRFPSVMTVGKAVVSRRAAVFATWCVPLGFEAMARTLFEKVWDEHVVREAARASRRCSTSTCTSSTR